MEPEEGRRQEDQVREAVGEHLREAQLDEAVEADFMGLVHAREEIIEDREEGADGEKGASASEALLPAAADVHAPEQGAGNERERQT